MNTLKVTTDLLRRDGTVSKPYIMISEFIDNSISSWIGYNKKIAEGDAPRDLTGCVVELFFDFSDSKNSKIFITDNSFGMSREALISSLQPSDRKRDFKTSNLNRYGVGMKVAAFWSGQKLTIRTKNENNSIFTCIDLNELDEKTGGVVEFEVKEYKHNIDFFDPESSTGGLEHGSQFIIENVDPVRYDLLKPEKQKTFISVLGYKFNRFISKGANINVLIKNPAGEMNKIVVESKTPRPEVILDWADHIYNKNKSWKNDKEKIVKWFRDFKQKMKNESLDSEIIKKAERSFAKGEPLIWDEEMYLGEDINLKIKIGILKNPKTKSKDESNQSYLKYQGFSVFESDRAIMCSPNELTDSFGSKNYLGGLKASYGGEAVDYRVFGEFDLDELLDAGKVKLSDNKFGFQWNDVGFEDKFLSWVRNWVEKTKILIKNLTTFQDKYDDTDKILSRMDDDTLKNNLSTPKIDVDGEANTAAAAEKKINEYNYIMYQDDEMKVFKKIKIIHEENNLVSEDFFSFKEDETGRCIITINLLHPVWQPVIKKSESLKKEISLTLHRLVFLFVWAENKFEGFGSEINKIANKEFEEII